MKTVGKRKAKAENESERSDSIVVSFDHVWLERLHTKSFCWVLRKRIPASCSPETMYIHVNAPVSAVAAQAHLEEVRRIPLSEAIANRAKLDLSESEIIKYFSGEESVGLYVLGDIRVLDEPISVAEIRKEMIYNPPQSFFILSNEAKRTIDHLFNLSGHA
jgi:predicted transcriptional regulator